MIITHNINAMNISRQQNIGGKDKKKTMEKLSSGYRVNRAADDAAGLSISEKMRCQIRGLTQASQNMQDGISLIQTADGAMAEITSILNRGTELCVKAANDVLAAEDRNSIQMELDALIGEIDVISERTMFNNRYLLKGDNAEIVGYNDPPVIYGRMPAWASLDSSSASVGYMASTYQTSNGVSHSASILDLSTFDPTQIASSYGTGFYMTCCTCDNHYSLEFTSGTDSSLKISGRHYIYKIGIDDALSPEDIVDKMIQATNGQPNRHFTCLVKDSSDSTKLIIYDNRNITSVKADSDSGLIGAGVAHTLGDGKTRVGDLYLQIGANRGEDMKLSLPAMSTDLLGISGVAVQDHAKASNGIRSFQAALKYVDEERSKMGAIQNRLEYTIDNVDNYQENLTDAESDIRDTDMAEEMIKNARNSVLEQARFSLLAQARQDSESVLFLLQ